jgi:hypothetical protein
MMRIDKHTKKTRGSLAFFSKQPKKTEGYTPEGHRDTGKNRKKSFKPKFNAFLKNRPNYAYLRSKPLNYQETGNAQPHSLVIGCPEISHHDFVGASFKIGHLRSFRNIDQSVLLAAAGHWIQLTATLLLI